MFHKHGRSRKRLVVRGLLSLCCLAVVVILAAPEMSLAQTKPRVSKPAPVAIDPPPAPPLTPVPAGFSGGFGTGGFGTGFPMGAPGGTFPPGTFGGGPGFPMGGFPGGSGFSGFPGSGPVPSGRISVPVFSTPAGGLPTLSDATPVRDLLPPAPTSLMNRPRHLLPASLEQITEIAFQEPVKPEREKALQHTRDLVAKIMHLHTKKMDSYMETLVAHRPDLQGVPFTLGAACRSNPERMTHFSGVLQFIRGSMGGELSVPLTEITLARRESNEAVSDQFWQQFTAGLGPRINEVDRRGKAKSTALFREAHVAALMQVCGPEQGAMRKGLTRHMAGVPHASSSQALARLAIFSPEDSVRHEAIEALKVRKDRDYGDILVEGLRYPWPEVAQRAADAIIELERKDLVPALVAVLEEADPRLPREVTRDGKTTHVVREMVRINHHRNCFLCHAPAANPASGPEAAIPVRFSPSPSDPSEVLAGAVPIPGEPLPSFSDGYRNSTPELAVRIDVTYLRQDFSTFMKVAGASPWPEMQRFDFLVRTRDVTDEEREAFRKAAPPAEEGVLNPYHRVAVRALRELTGRDAAPTAEAWRKLLKLPERRS